MVIAHLSHYELEHIATTADSAIFSGTLAACKRMAAAHGMEIERYEGCIISCDGSTAIYAPASESQPNRIIYKSGGMIQRCQDGYSLVMPIGVWINN